MPSTTVFTRIFGSGYNTDDFTNACVTRVSLALLSGGMKNVTNRIMITEKTHEYYGRFIESGAAKLKDYLVKSWGQPDILIKFPVAEDQVKNELNGKKAVYIMIPKFPSQFGGNSGHATLWTGKRVIGAHYYIGENTHAIYFWELT